MPTVWYLISVLFLVTNLTIYRVSIANGISFCVFLSSVDQFQTNVAVQIPTVRRNYWIPFFRVFFQLLSAICITIHYMRSTIMVSIEMVIQTNSHTLTQTHKMLQLRKVKRMCVCQSKQITVAKTETKICEAKMILIFVYISGVQSWERYEQMKS